MESYPKLIIEIIMYIAKNFIKFIKLKLNKKIKEMKE